MIILADSGSTKTTWCLIKECGRKLFFNTEGYNPFFVDSTYIVSSLTKNLPQEVLLVDIKAVHFYGAGCFSEKSSIINKAIKAVFKNADVYVELDLLAAARALLGTHAGFASILGTGTNTCIYDGKKIINNIDSLGYVLGDEGSGTAIGKKILGDFIRGYMPKAISERFEETYHLTKKDIFERIYMQPLANRYCAGFCEFVNEHINHDYLNELVCESFDELFRNIVSHYPNYRTYSFNCVGSIGHVFSSILIKNVEKFGMKMGTIMQKPIDGLVAYHQR